MSDGEYHRALIKVYVTCKDVGFIKGWITDNELVFQRLQVS